MADKKKENKPLLPGKGPKGNYQMWVIFASIAIIFAIMIFNSNSGLKEKNFNDLKEMVANGDVKKVVLIQDPKMAEVTLRTEALENAKYKQDISTSPLASKSGPHYSIKIVDSGNFDQEFRAGATEPGGILNVATRIATSEVGDALVVQTDLCLDEFTDHGHCGVLDDRGAVDNDATLVRYREMAIAQAEAGSQLVGLSGMMDGQVAAVRDALDSGGFPDTPLLGYAAKYASAFYGPFREAVQSSLVGDRRTYQQDPANRREGTREVLLDIEEGADILMVKPAMGYLDVLADAAALSPVPVWAYQVSGEYAMIEAAAANGWIDRRRAVEESVVGIKRAGADAVLTYFASEIARWLK